MKIRVLADETQAEISNGDIYEVVSVVDGWITLNQVYRVKMEEEQRPPDLGIHVSDGVRSRDRMG